MLAPLLVSKVCFSPRSGEWLPGPLLTWGCPLWGRGRRTGCGYGMVPVPRSTSQQPHLVAV